MFPEFLRPLSDRFRRRRNKKLVGLIRRIHDRKGEPIEVLDVGGSFRFWSNVEATPLCHVTLLNLPEELDDLVRYPGMEESRFSVEGGDARDLSRWPDGRFDLVVSNSVIEHVGSWRDMETAAAEMRRVASNGWVQAPALEFPVEQHVLLPVVHWLADPLRTRMTMLLRPAVRRWGYSEARMNIHYTNLPSRSDMRHLFPGATIWTEWLVFPKSHVATWSPEG